MLNQFICLSLAVVVLGKLNPEKPTALLAASTGVAAINIDGTTINTALAIPINTGDVLSAINV